jgi:hypothetical protein
VTPAPRLFAAIKPGNVKLPDRVREAVGLSIIRYAPSSRG